MKFCIDITKSQYNKLVKRSEMLGQDPEYAAKMVLSVLTDGSDAEFIDYLELTGTPSVHKIIDEDKSNYDYAEEWEYNDEDERFS
jgi:maleate cis-trans isomerase